MTNMNELSMNELDNVVGGKGTCLIIEDSANCFEAITVTGDFSRDEMFAIYNYKIHNSPISKDLKKMGFKFIGSTIIYSFMQAVGMVNDHLKGCRVYEDVLHANIS